MFPGKYDAVVINCPRSAPAPLAYHNSPAHGHPGNVRDRLGWDRPEQRAADAHWLIELPDRGRLILHVRHGTWVSYSILILVEEKEGLVAPRRVRPPARGGGPLPLVPPQVMEVVRVGEGVAMGYSEQDHFKGEEEVLKSIDNVLAVPGAHPFNDTERVQHFDQKALPEGEKNLLHVRQHLCMRLTQKMYNLDEHSVWNEGLQPKEASSTRRTTENAVALHDTTLPLTPRTRKKSPRSTTEAPALKKIPRIRRLRTMLHPTTWICPQTANYGHRAAEKEYFHLTITPMRQLEIEVPTQTLNRYGCDPTLLSSPTVPKKLDLKTIANK